MLVQGDIRPMQGRAAGSFFVINKVSFKSSLLIKNRNSKDAEQAQAIQVLSS